MISLRYLLGMIPKTAEIEEKEAALIKEYNDLKEYQNSDELKRYEELKSFVNSADFKSRKKSIESQNFKSTHEFKEMQRLNALKKSPRVKNYFKILNSHENAEYDTIKKSGEYNDPSALDEATLKSNRYKAYNKFVNSGPFKMFESYVQSGEHAEYEKLEAFINGDEFKKVKEYMELPSKEKWARSDEYKQLQEYTTLNSSEKIKWFYSVKDTKKFDELKTWNIVFEDNFDASSLNSKNWLTKYYWGDANLHDSYSLTTDLQYVTDGKNLELNGSNLKIITKKENATGKSWDPARGFFPRDFEYTSGLINTGKSYRQQYGKIKAKIRINEGQAASHAFCLMSQRITPQVDIFKYEDGKFTMNYFWGTDKTHRKVKRLGAKKVENDYFIFELDWTQNKMVWKINGLEIRSQEASLPSEAMYIFFGSAMYNQPSAALPSTFEIDWVRWYQKN
jgi:hypothetical protein